MKTFISPSLEAINIADTANGLFDCGYEQGWLTNDKSYDYPVGDPEIEQPSGS